MLRVCAVCLRCVSARTLMKQKWLLVACTSNPKRGKRLERLTDPGAGGSTPHLILPLLAVLGLLAASGPPLLVGVPSDPCRNTLKSDSVTQIRRHGSQALLWPHCNHPSTLGGRCRKTSRPCPMTPRCTPCSHVKKEHTQKLHVHIMIKPNRHCPSAVKHPGWACHPPACPTRKP